jgi:2-oxoisovalerate dehydrogenase E2 component (dihydrolipoyl transacylase)
MTGVQRFCVPDLGEGLEDATLSEWNVAVGDDVELNQALCTVETAKAAVEIPSPFAGRVVTLGGEPGEVLAVGALLVAIDTEPDADPVPTQDDGESSAPEPVAPVRTPVLVGYGADAELDVSRRSRAKAKPAVRKLAAELLVDLSDVEPGPDGVVTRDAVLAAAGVTAAGRADIAHDVLPVRGVHAEMAKRMSLSRSQIPDAHANLQVDCTRLLELRDRLRVVLDKEGDQEGDAAAPITLFVLTLRLLVLALNHHRILNSTWIDGPDGPQVHTHHAVHLGFGVAAPRGLLVPVVADAQAKTTRELAAAVARLIGDARTGALKPAELQGSTFTVSNFGALGLDDGVPVINHPEAAILGMGSLKPRPVVIDDALAVRPTMTLTCAFDHRVADGAQVAGFLCELRELIETPETALLDL